MAMKSWSVETLNSFVMDNFKPYAWCEMWEETIPDRDQMFYFRICVRPNTYARTNNYYRAGMVWEHIPASCCLELPEPEFYQSYVFSIPMLKGESIKNGKRLEHDPQRKFKYWNHLANQSIRSIELLDLDECHGLKSVKEVFGNNKETTPLATGWEKVASYVDGRPRPEWSFV